MDFFNYYINVCDDKSELKDAYLGLIMMFGSATFAQSVLKLLDQPYLADGIFVPPYYVGTSPRLHQSNPSEIKLLSLCNLKWVSPRRGRIKYTWDILLRYSGEETSFDFLNLLSNSVRVLDKGGEKLAESESKYVVSCLQNLCRISRIGKDGSRGWHRKLDNSCFYFS